MPVTPARFFRVVGWEKFQHYRDRSPPWIKFYTTVLDDYEIGNLPDASKAHLFAIWLLASRYDNKIPLDSTWLTHKLNATCKVDLDILLKSGKIELIQSCSEVLADCDQTARPETETETETEKKDISIIFESFWKEYPRKIGKGQARKAFASALKKTDLQTLLDGAKRYAATRSGEDVKFTAHPATWLNGERWLDDGMPLEAEISPADERKRKEAADAHQETLRRSQAKIEAERMARYKAIPSGGGGSFVGQYESAVDSMAKSFAGKMRAE